MNEVDTSKPGIYTVIYRLENVVGGSFIDKTMMAPMSSFRTKKCEQLSKCFVDELVCL